jgi:hypothetical protein
MLSRLRGFGVFHGTSKIPSQSCWITGVRSAHDGPRLPAAGQVHGDKKFGKGLDSSDITVTYPNEVIMVEVASHRLTVRSKRDGDDRALRRDLTEMIGRRPRQLRRSIDAMKPRHAGVSPTLSFDRLDPDRVARFRPVIVTVTPVHRSPLLDESLRTAMPNSPRPTTSRRSRCSLSRISRP